jgi:geranylgeranyl diphosphate synthase type I
VLCRGGAEGEELAAWCAADRPAQGDSEDVLRDMAALIERAGGRDWASAEAEEQLRLADAALDRVCLPDGPRAELADLARYLTRRES